MRVLPDVTSDVNAETPSTLQWVGVEDIAVPTTMNRQDGHRQTVAAKTKEYVSLEQPDLNGTHMSRPHTLINRLAESDFNKKTVSQVLDNMIHSQSSLGQAAKIALSFNLLLKKQTLLSSESSYQAYLVMINVENNSRDLYCEFEPTILYSSTCPCTASLSRQLHADAVNTKISASTYDKFGLLAWIQSSASSIATTHSQPSYACIRFSLTSNDWPNLSSLIFQLAEIICTSMKTALKRVDEQEFARLNAENLIFFEGAARRI